MNSVSKLQFAKRTYSEIQLMTSMAECNEEGETPLLIAIKKRNWSLIHEFLAIFKKFYVEPQSMPPMCYFSIDQLSNQIPITELIDFLINDICDENWLIFLAKVFIKSTSFTREDRIIALELIGASFMMSIGSLRSTGLCDIGLQCWRDAMILRSANPYALPKIPATSVSSEASSVVFGNANEVMEIEELSLLQEELRRDYMPWGRKFYKRMQLQALLVVRRISIQETLGHPNWLYLESLLRFGSDVLPHRIWSASLQPQNVVLNVENRIVINTCHLIMEELRNGFDPKMIFPKTLRVFIETLHLMSCYFVTVKMMEDELDESRREELSYANFLVSTEFINAVANLFPEQENISSVKFESHCFASVIYNFLFVLDSISPQLTYQEKKVLEEYYSSYIRNFFPTRTTTVLHEAVQEIKKSDYLYMLRVSGCGVGFKIQGKLNTIHSLIKLFLKLGADPNAIDEMGRTPLHILAGMKQVHLNNYLPIYQTLVNAGSYLDLSDDNDETVRTVLKKMLKRYTQKGEMVDPYFESLIDSVLPLTCLCTRVIRRHRIPYQDRLPLILQKLVAP
jgi:hypothetical protein